MNKKIFQVEVRIIKGEILKKKKVKEKKTQARERGQEGKVEG
jgi:hypothetical protein